MVDVDGAVADVSPPPARDVAHVLPMVAIGFEVLNHVPMATHDAFLLAIFFCGPYAAFSWKEIKTLWRGEP